MKLVPDVDGPGPSGGPAFPRLRLPSPNPARFCPGYAAWTQSLLSPPSWVALARLFCLSELFPREGDGLSLPRLSLYLSLECTPTTANEWTSVHTGRWPRLVSACLRLHTRQRLFRPPSPVCLQDPISSECPPSPCPRFFQILLTGPPLSAHYRPLRARDRVPGSAVVTLVQPHTIPGELLSATPP